MALPTSEPTQITAGDSLTWLRSLPDYPAGAGWVLHYVLLSQGQTPIKIDGTAQDNDHLISLDAATTDGWTAASYRWTAFVTNGAQRVTLSSGAVDILPDPTKAQATDDPRTENQKILAAIKAVLAGELTNPIVKYRIGGREGREVERYSRMELLKLQTLYEHRVAVEMGQASFIGSIPIQFEENHGIPGSGYGYV